MLKFFQVERPIIRFLGDCLKPFKVWVAALLFVTICIAASSSLKPYVLSVLLNFLANNNINDNSVNLGMNVLFYMLASLFPVIIYRLDNFIWVNFAPPLRHQIAALSMQHVMSHPYHFFQSHPAANIANKIKELITAIPNLITTIFDGFVCVFFTLAIAIGTVWSVNYKFAVGLIVWVTIYIIGSTIILKHAKKIGSDGVICRSMILAKIVEILENIKCIRALTREDFEKEKLNEILGQNQKIETEKERSVVRAFAFQGFSFIIYQGICLAWLISELKSGFATLGDFALILSMNLFFVDYLRKVSKNFVEFTDHLENIQQCLKIIISSEKQSTQSEPVNSNDITFEKVCFSYPGGQPLFQNKSVHIKSGEKVAIVGHSGSGKSTFIDLILKFYDVDSGKIKIGNTSIDHLSLTSLRKAVSVVPQAPSLFCGTIMENIRYGKIEASDADVIEAAKKSAVDDFIQTLPMGYQTAVDSFGTKLSAGQRQRIAIARAVLKNAPILILDEAMSHLDALTEGKIQDSLLKLMEHKTTIIVTHRLSTLLNRVDKILVFDNGKIIESGTHEDLILKNGTYKKLWNKANISS